MANNQRNASDVPLAQWAHEEAQKAVQSTNAHLYQEKEQEQQSIQALGKNDLLTMIAIMQQQMAQMQRQLQEQQDNIVEVSHHQQEVDQQASQLLAAIQQSPPQQPLPAVPQFPSAPAPQQPAVIQTQQQIIPAAPKIDAAKPPAAFSGTSGEDVESCILAIGLYFAANEAMTDNQKAVRMALNLSGTAQWQIHNAADVPLQSLTLAAMKAELLAAFRISNRDQMACRHLRNLRQIASVDSYAQVFRSTYYTCIDVLPAKAKACFIEGLKQYMRLYIKEYSPETLDAAILLAQAFDSTRFRLQQGQNPRGGRTFELFGSNQGGWGRYYGSNTNGSNCKR